MFQLTSEEAKILQSSRSQFATLNSQSPDGAFLDHDVKLECDQELSSQGVVKDVHR